MAFFGQPAFGQMVRGLVDQNLLSRGGEYSSQNTPSTTPSSFSSSNNIANQFQSPLYANTQLQDIAMNRLNPTNLIGIERHQALLNPSFSLQNIAFNPYDHGQEVGQGLFQQQQIPNSGYEDTSLDFWQQLLQQLSFF